MIFIQTRTGDKACMGLEIFDKLNEVKNFLPKFDMPINTEGNNHVSLIGYDDIVNYFTMHVADLIILRSRDILQ